MIGYIRRAVPDALEGIKEDAAVAERTRSNATVSGSRSPQEVSCP